VRGKYVKTNIWGHKAADHLLVADSQVYYLNIGPGITNFPELTLTFQGYSGAPFAPKDIVWPLPAPATDFVIDGSRHLKGGYQRSKIIGLKGINGLFCDGHAETISVHDAWLAIMYPNQRHP